MEEHLSVSKLQHFACCPCGCFCFLSKKIQMWACGSSQNTVLLALQKIVHKGDECILKDNNERSKWYVTGPGGVDMLVPSVGLIIPPPNPLAVDLSSKYVVQVLAGCNVDTGGEKCG